MAENPSNIFFTFDIAKVVEIAISTTSYSSIFVLTDENTQRDCLPLIQAVIPDYAKIINIRSGEENKNLKTCEKIWEELTNAHADRHTLLINLGGGVICDMGGFCARTYKRGIDFWNIPTTLLSQVDASVGGKLGIDFGSYKNHIGLFSEPDKVFLDSRFFNTLPKGELVSGFAEMVKHALIRDKEMFNQLRVQDIETMDWSVWIPNSVAIKQAVVEADPTEKNQRKILNFGHTVGHAIESFLLDSPRKLRHGDAIAIGMIAETYLSEKLLGMSPETAAIIYDYLLKVFPTSRFSEDEIEQIATLAVHDKKNKDGKIKAVLLKAIGDPIIDQEISLSDIKKSLVFYNQLPK